MCTGVVQIIDLASTADPGQRLPVTVHRHNFQLHGLRGRRWLAYFSTSRGRGPFPPPLSWSWRRSLRPPRTAACSSAIQPLPPDGCRSRGRWISRSTGPRFPAPFRCVPAGHQQGPVLRLGENADSAAPFFLLSPSCSLFGVVFISFPFPFPPLPLQLFRAILQIL